MVGPAGASPCSNVTFNDLCYLAHLEMLQGWWLVAVLPLRALEEGVCVCVCVCVCACVCVLLHTVDTPCTVRVATPVFQHHPKLCLRVLKVVRLPTLRASPTSRTVISYENSHCGQAAFVRSHREGLLSRREL
jgi:hypothetical protein